MKTQPQPAKPGGDALPEMSPEQKQLLVSGAQAHVGNRGTGSGDTPYRQALMAQLRAAELPLISTGE